MSTTEVNQEIKKEDLEGISSGVGGKPRNVLFCIKKLKKKHLKIREWSVYQMLMRISDQKN